VGAEAQQVAGAGLGLGRQGRRLVLADRLGRQLVEQRCEVVLVIARALEVAELLEQVDELLGVVAGEVVGAVVDEQDAPGLLVVDVDEGDGDLPPAELASGEQRVVSRQDLPGAAATTIGRYWPLRSRLSPIAARSPRRGLSGWG
jgi:hypothetical protein